MRKVPAPTCSSRALLACGRARRATTVTLSGTSLTFISQLVGTSSAAQTVTLTNAGNATLSISSIAIIGANPGDFAQTNTCGGSIAGRTNCSLSVTFTPSATGSRSASLFFTDNALGSPQTVALSGTGVAPTVSLSASSLSFGSQVVGATSTAQTVTLRNTGNATFTITSIAITGANAGAFAQTNTCGSSVAAGANFTLSLTFTPAAAGMRTGAITITDNASDSPQSISSLPSECLTELV